MAKQPRKISASQLQANKYDKIVKENLLKAINGIVERVIGIEAVRIEVLNPDLQHTRERKADFVAKVLDAQQQEMILHIEFQVLNDSRMLNRMLEYKAMLMRKFPKEKILQYVIFLGNKQPRMRSSFTSPDHSYRFHLAWLQEIDYEKFLNSEHLEEVILAVLADFGNTAAEVVAEAIYEKVHKNAETELEVMRYLEQLRILSNIRNLHPLIEIIMEKVSRFFVEERDPFYKKGKLEGKLEGILEGKLEGKLEGILESKRIIVMNMLLSGSTDYENIAKIVEVDLSFVLSVKAEFEKNSQ
jgi:predicted transposase/invertase (TIGR01784 family)